MERSTKLKYLLFTAITTIVAVVAVNLYSTSRGGKASGAEEVEEPAPVPLNHLLENSMCDIQETKKFDAAILRFMRYWGIRGGSFALMRNDSLLYAKGYGFSNTADSTICEVKNIFRVASVSKLITAVAIMQPFRYRPSPAPG